MSQIVDFNLLENTKDLKNAFKVFAFTNQNISFEKVDSELNKLVQDCEKLKEIFKEFETLLKSFEKESKEYNAILSIMCAIDYQIENL